MLFALRARARCGLEYFEGLDCCCSVGPLPQPSAYNPYAHGQWIFQPAPVARQHKCFLILKVRGIPKHRGLFYGLLPKMKAHLLQWNIARFWFFSAFQSVSFFRKEYRPTALAKRY